MLMAKFKSVSSLDMALIAITLCALRWMFIANGYDYGWDYETGYRVYTGGIYGRDFYTALGPLSYSLIGFVFKALGPNWFWVYPLYYSCWILTLVGVWILFKTLSNQKEFLALVIMAVAPVSIPHITALHLYNCLGYCLAIWSAVFCFIYFKKGQINYLIPAGICAAFALFTKQNLGLGVALLNIVLLFINFVITKEKFFKNYLVSILAWIFPLCCFSGALFYFFSKEIGFRELIQLMFTDAAQAKGNLFTMLKVAIPRISFGYSEKHDQKWLIQHVAEIISYIVVVFVNYYVLMKRSSRVCDGENKKDLAASIKFVSVVFVAFLIVLIVPVLFPEKVYFIREKYFWFNTRNHVSNILLPFLFWLMILNLICCGWVFWKKTEKSSEDRRFFLLLSILAIGMNILVCASRFSYLFLNTPLLLGLVILINLKVNLWDRKQLLTIFVALWIGAYFFYPTHSLGQLTKLRGKILSGLWFAESDRDFVEFYTEKIKPWVENKRTLWLMDGGPHSLSGAIPVRNVSNLYFDQYNVRIEESLVKDWMAQPPEVIVVDWFAASEQSVWLRGNILKDWLGKNYVQVAKINNKRILRLNH